MARLSKVAAPNIDIQIERWPIERLIPRAQRVNKTSARKQRGGIERLASEGPAGQPAEASAGCRTSFVDGDAGGFGTCET